MLWQRIRNLRYPDGIRNLLAGRENRSLRIAAAVCLALLAVNVLLYAGAVAPAADRLRTLRGRLQEAKQQHADALLFQKQKASLAGIAAGIPTQKDVPLLIKDIVQSARRLHLSIGAVNSDIPAAGAEGISMLVFSVPVSGSYPDLKRFIYSVETMDRLVGIQDAKFTTEKGRVKLTLKLVTYVRGA